MEKKSAYRSKYFVVYGKMCKFAANLKNIINLKDKQKQ